MKTPTLKILLALMMISSPALAAPPTVLELVRKIDRLFRSESAEAEMTMKIETPDWERELRMTSISLGLKKTFIRIVSPAKDRGISTLQMGQEMWNYFPKINKVIKIPPSMMMGSWMGSDFTNDDLVRQTSMEEEYNSTLEEKPGEYILTMIPKANTAVVWGKIVTRMRSSDLIPIEQVFYNEKGTPMRKMVFSEIQDYGGTKLPKVMKLESLTKPGNSTTITYVKLKLNGPVSESNFTLKKLQERF